MDLDYETNFFNIKYSTREGGKKQPKKMKIYPTQYTNFIAAKSELLFKQRTSDASLLLLKFLDLHISERNLRNLID